LLHPNNGRIRDFLRRAIVQQPRRVEFRSHVDQFVLNRLKFRDRPSKLFPNLRVLEGRVVRALGHPDGQRCWYYFPTTQVASSDGQSFAAQPYPVDAIMCGDHVVWINRDMAESQLPLVTDSTARQPFTPVTR